jgi:N-acyl homoserine lactone hydrolase
VGDLHVTEIIRLHLGELYVVDQPWPVHGFVLLHPTLGAVLVDTGCGGPDALLREYRVVNRSVADALATHDLSPADVRLVINTHLHFDHCGQNPAFPHARLCVQRAELARVRRDEPDMRQWIDTAGIRFELFDGSIDLADDLHVIATPGHTSGHQSILSDTERGVELFIGDAAYTRPVWDRAKETSNLAPGQAEDHESWYRSLQDLRALEPARVHFCHDAS